VKGELAELKVQLLREFTDELASFWWSFWMIITGADLFHYHPNFIKGIKGHKACSFLPSRFLSQTFLLCEVFKGVYKLNIFVWISHERLLYKSVEFSIDYEQLMCLCNKRSIFFHFKVVSWLGADYILGATFNTPGLHSDSLLVKTLKWFRLQAVAV